MGSVGFVLYIVVREGTFVLNQQYVNFGNSSDEGVISDVL